MLRNEGLNNEIFMFRFGGTGVKYAIIDETSVIWCNKENKIISKIMMKWLPG